MRNEIITLAHGINKKGECGTAVRYNFKCHWGNHYDSPSFFVIMTYDYLVHTGDMSVLGEKVNGASIYELICAVLERFKREVDGTGLLVKGGKFNRRDWCDNVFRGGYVTYDEALYCRALQAAGEISGMGHCLHHHRLFVAAAPDMCEGCLSSSKNEMNEGCRGDRLHGVFLL